MILRTLTILTFPLFSFSASTLRQKFKEINSDEDKTVSPAEFVSWFNYQDIEYLKKNARDHFSMFDKNNDQKVDWDEYAGMSFGLNRQDICNDIFREKRPYEFSKLAEQVQLAILAAVRRWKAAATGFSMSHGEFTVFTYPELYEHMGQTLVAETIDKYDINKDRMLTVQEVLNKKSTTKYTPAQIQAFSAGKLENTESHLLGLHDNDQDGVLDDSELGDWVMGNRKLIRKEEAEELFSQMDTDGNGKMDFTEFENGVGLVKGSSVGIHIREEL